MSVQAPPELSEREIELLSLLVTGATNQQIALRLHISVNTVKTHLRNIFFKLNVESRTEATLYAIQHQLVGVTNGTPAQPPAAEPAAPARPELPAPAEWSWVPRWVVLAVITLFAAAVAGVFFWPYGAAPRAEASSPFIDETLVQEPPMVSGGSGRWHRQVPLGLPRARFAQASVRDAVYVIGGLTAEGFSADTEVFSAATNRWERRAAKPTAAANISAAVVRGLIYIPGGYDAENQALTVHEVYDPATDAWRTLAPLPRGLCAYAIAPAEGGYYVFGGWDGTHYLDTVYRYDIAADTWSLEASLSRPRAFAAAANESGVIYLAGGYDGHRVLDLFESYDPLLADAGLNPWRELQPLHVPRAGLGLAALNGSLYAVGGGWQRPVSTSERYDIAGGVWSDFDTPLSGAWRMLGLSPVELRNGSFLAAVGGWSGGYLSAVWYYQAMYRVFVP